MRNEIIEISSDSESGFSDDIPQSHSHPKYHCQNYHPDEGSDSLDHYYDSDSLDHYLDSDSPLSGEVAAPPLVPNYDVDEHSRPISLRQRCISKLWETTVTPSMICQDGAMRIPNHVGRVIPSEVLFVPVIERTSRELYLMELHKAERNPLEISLSGSEWRTFISDHNVKLGDELHCIITSYPIEIIVTVIKNPKNIDVAKKGVAKNGASSSSSVANKKRSWF